MRQRSRRGVVRARPVIGFGRSLDDHRPAEDRDPADDLERSDRLREEPGREDDADDRS
jgi:hypothetical protein